MLGFEFNRFLPLPSVRIIIAKIILHRSVARNYVYWFSTHYQILLLIFNYIINGVALNKEVMLSCGTCPKTFTLDMSNPRIVHN